MLKINLIEQVAKQQEVLNTKNKVSSDFVQKTLYYSEEFPVTKAVATNTGNINASDMMGTQTVFPSDKAGADGEYLIYLMPRFVRGKNVYRLFNTESSKQINNTVKVSNSSLGNYIYQVDQTSTPEQAKEEGETVEVDNTERSVERNRSNKIKPLQEGETPEQYQERFMKEYQDLVRDINGALSDIDPEQVLKQWQQKQKEIEEKKLEQQAVETFTMMEEGCQEAENALNVYTENNCDLQFEINKSIFFETSILKNKSDAVCKKAKEALSKFLQEMGQQFLSLGIVSTNPFADQTFVDNLADKLLKNGDTKERIKEIIDALTVFKTDKKGRVAAQYQVPLMYLMLEDLRAVNKDEKQVSVTPELEAWLDSVANGANQLQIQLLVNEFQANRDIAYVADIKYAENIAELAKAMLLATTVEGRVNVNRPVESFVAQFNKAVLSLELGKHLTPAEVDKIQLKVGITEPLKPTKKEEIGLELRKKDSSYTPKQFEESIDLLRKACIVPPPPPFTDLNTATVEQKKAYLQALYDTYILESELSKTGFSAIPKTQYKQYAQRLQEQVPTWLFSPADPENPTEKELEELYKLNQEYTTDERQALLENDPRVADLRGFSTGSSTVQFDIAGIINSHGVIASYGDGEFTAFVDAYVNNLAKDYFGVAEGCSRNKKHENASETEKQNMDICDRLTAHVEFILGRPRASATGGHTDKGETFENVLMLDQLTRMLPKDMTEDDSRIRFNGKTGREALSDYLRCISNDTRHTLNEADPKTTTEEEIITADAVDYAGTSKDSQKEKRTLGDLAEKILEKPIKAQQVKERAEEIGLEAKAYFDGTSNFQAAPINSDTKQEDKDNIQTIHVNESVYVDAFHAQVDPLLKELKDAEGNEELQKQIRKKIDTVVFKFLTISLVNQPTDDATIELVISAVSHRLETDPRFKDNEELKKSFRSKFFHVINYVKQYRNTTELGKTFDSDELNKLVASELLDIDSLVEIVASKETFDKFLEETKINGRSLDDWITDTAVHFARKLTVSDLNLQTYTRHFKDKFSILLQKYIASGNTLDKRVVIHLFHQAKLEAIRATFTFINPQTPLSSLYTEETQEKFLQRLQDARAEPATPTLPVFINAKSNQRNLPAKVSGAQKKARENREKFGSAIDQVMEPAASATQDDSGTEEQLPDFTYDGKVATADANSKDSLKEQLDRFFPGLTLPIPGTKRKQNLTSGNLPSLFLYRLLDVHRGIKTADGKDLTPEQIKTVQEALFNQRGKYKIEDNPVSFNVKPNGKVAEKKKNKSEKKELHTLSISFSIDGQNYTIEIPQPAPPGYAIRKSLYDLNFEDIVLKNAMFFGQASKETSVLGDSCPAVSVDNKLNPNAMLTIQDDEGTTFFNISKLEGVPGAASGFGDLAHLKVKGLKRDQNGAFILDGAIDLEMSVVEGKVGAAKASLASFSRIQTIQNSIIEATMSDDVQKLRAIKSARYNVFLGRAHNGRIAYGRAKGYDAEVQLGRALIGRKTSSTDSDKSTKTASINANNLQKILKSIWI